MQYMHTISLGRVRLSTYPSRHSWYVIHSELEPFLFAKGVPILVQFIHETGGGLPCGLVVSFSLHPPFSDTIRIHPGGQKFLRLSLLNNRGDGVYFREKIEVLSRS